MRTSRRLYTLAHNAKLTVVYDTALHSTFQATPLPFCAWAHRVSNPLFCRQKQTRDLSCRQTRFIDMKPLKCNHSRFGSNSNRSNGREALPSSSRCVNFTSGKKGVGSLCIKP